MKLLHVGYARSMEEAVSLPHSPLILPGVSVRRTMACMAWGAFVGALLGAVVGAGLGDASDPSGRVGMGALIGIFVGVLLGVLLGLWLAHRKKAPPA